MPFPSPTPSKTASSTKTNKAAIPIHLHTAPLKDNRGQPLGISTPDRPPALGREQIQSIIEAQTAALHQALTQPNQDPSHTPSLPSISLKTLSHREREIFLLIGQGLNPAQIADRLHLSIHTIHAHRTNIREKLDYPDAHALTYAAIHWLDLGHPWSKNGHNESG